MNPILISIDRYTYRNLRVLMMEVVERLKYGFKFSGIGMIDWQLVCTGLLANRYRFKYDDDCRIEFTTKKQITLTLHVYEAQAIFFMLRNSNYLPENMTIVYRTLGELLSDYQPIYQKTDFQIWYEENYKNLDISYTELRDEYSQYFAELLKQFQTQKNNNLAQKEHGTE